MIHLICGPSCAGKSSFYTTGAFARMTGESALPVLFPNQLEQGLVPPPASIIHYNMMRPLQFMPVMREAPAAAMNDR